MHPRLMLLDAFMQPDELLGCRCRARKSMLRDFFVSSPCRVRMGQTNLQLTTTAFGTFSTHTFTRYHLCMSCILPKDHACVVRAAGSVDTEHRRYSTLQSMILGRNKGMNAGREKTTKP